MRAVRGPERVVYVHVAELGQLCGERRVVCFFLWVEAHVLQQGDAARGERPDSRLGRSPNGIVDKCDRLTEQPT